ncbi:MAG TPA: hypothetical protein VMW52_05675 [Phycisphaerae bacterium]|nr:hypothetical protein [Phycisphaerae bacterium]
MRYRPVTRRVRDLLRDLRRDARRRWPPHAAVVDQLVAAALLELRRLEHFLAAAEQEGPRGRTG